MNSPLATAPDGTAAANATHTFQKGGVLLERSLLYREFLAEREEILKHKLLESEMAGQDIGLKSARVNWVVHHRAQWRRARRSQSATLPV